VKASNTKIQSPDKIQTSNSKIQGSIKIQIPSEETEMPPSSAASRDGLSSRPPWRTSGETRKKSAAMVRPPPRLKISEWAEAHAYIPEKGNAEPGKYHLSRMPHQAEMLDDPLDPEVRETFWMMASQYSGKTLCGIFICEYVICVLRRSLIMARDTKERAAEWMRDKFMPTANATPAMAGLLKEPRERDSESTTTSRSFPGGSFKVLGAKSVGGLRATTAGVVIQDEIDAYAATKEGDACALIDRAAKTFGDAWKLMRASKRVTSGVIFCRARFAGSFNG
jgi:phage terminase large subunit GpA-like protein